MNGWEKGAAHTCSYKLILSVGRKLQFESRDSSSIVTLISTAKSRRQTCRLHKHPAADIDCGNFVGSWCNNVRNAEQSEQIKIGSIRAGNYM